MGRTLLVQQDTILELLRELAQLSPADVTPSMTSAGLRQRAAALIDEIAHQDEQRCHYTCEGKGGRYELLGHAKGAGSSRGQVRTIYRSTESGELFLREPADFASRMMPIEEGVVPMRANGGVPIPVLARGFYLPLAAENSYNFLDDTDDPGDCDDSVPAVIIARAEYERVRIAVISDEEQASSEQLMVRA